MTVDFHKNAMQAYFLAMTEGKQADSEYVRELAYKFYEEDLKNETDKTRD